MAPLFKLMGIRVAPQTLTIGLLFADSLILKLLMSILKVTFINLPLQPDTSEPLKFSAILNIQEQTVINVA